MTIFRIVLTWRDQALEAKVGWRVTQDVSAAQDPPITWAVAVSRG